MKQNKDFQKYLQEIESPNYDGPDISQALSADASPIDKAKYKVCEKILAYQQDNKLPIEEVANKIKLTTAETKDIFHYQEKMMIRMKQTKILLEVDLFLSNALAYLLILM